MKRFLIFICILALATVVLLVLVLGIAYLVDVVIIGQ